MENQIFEEHAVVEQKKKVPEVKTTEKIRKIEDNIPNQKEASDGDSIQIKQYIPALEPE